VAASTVRRAETWTARRAPWQRPDNLTVQIVCVEDVPQDGNGLREQLARLAPPPLLQARDEIDGYRIEREIHASARSHIYLATDLETGGLVALKTPATDLQSDPELLERFMLEEWIARRLNSPHVLKPYPRTRERRFLYVAMEYVEGQTLAQWMIDNPRPDLETVRGIVEQVARGLQAFHRKEMLHQDLRPQNIMIDRTGTAKIIDFGSVSVAGIDEQARAGRPASSARCSTPRRNTSSATPAASARISIRSASSPTRCYRAACRTARRPPRCGRAGRCAD
jgi:serine/threonine protein kinase